jgi:hypothetical protein
VSWRPLRGERYLTGKPDFEFAEIVTKKLPFFDFEEAESFYKYLAEPGVTSDTWLRILGCNDRYFLLTRLFGRTDAVHPWLYERLREVEANPDDHLDLWSRDHYKSTCITYAGAIQEILDDPGITIGIFSHTKQIAAKFLSQIKEELERNTELKRIYADCLYAEPKKESPRWSIDGGIVVKRGSNPKEATVEAHGLVAGSRPRSTSSSGSTTTS